MNEHLTVLVCFLLTEQAVSGSSGPRASNVLFTPLQLILFVIYVQGATL